MSYNIAVAGKGGSGKTTVASLIIRYLLKNNLTPVLAVDADPNANLGESIGLEVGATIGSTLADFQKEKIKIPQGMTKESYLNLKMHEVVVEGKGVDLVTMGRGEGRDCYCYPNTVLRNFIDGLMGSYGWMVMDNEAGMEHLSRATTQNVDELLLVSGHSVKGVRTIARIRDLAVELNLIIKRMSVVINMVPGGLDPAVAAEMARLGLVPAAIVPLDGAIAEYDLKQAPLTGIPSGSPAVTAVDDFIAGLLSKKGVPVK